MEPDHINLIIATPGHSVVSDYLKSLLATANLLAEKGITWIWANGVSSHVSEAREITLNNNISADISTSKPYGGQIAYDKILWIDSDIIFTPEDVIKMYESDKDIISGVYLLSDGTVPVYPQTFAPGLRYEDVIKLNDLIEVQATGFGFICFKQGIFEKMERPWFQTEIGTTYHNGEIKKLPIMGEDMALCYRARKLGHNIWVDPSIKLIHKKTVNLTWNGIV